MTSSHFEGQIAKDSLYEGGTRVALMARFPGAISAGSTLSIPVSNLDLAPTILTAVGAAIPATLGADGFSWWKKAADKIAGGASTADPIDTRTCIVSEIEVSRSAVCGSLKFISNWDGADGAVNNYPSSTAAEQLYDLEADPTEQTNLVTDGRYESAVTAFRSYIACHDVDTTRETTTDTCDKSSISVPTTPSSSPPEQTSPPTPAPTSNRICEVGDGDCDACKNTAHTPEMCTTCRGVSWGAGIGPPPEGCGNGGGGNTG